MLRLAGPLILGYAGSQLMSMTDTAMVGRLGAHALAGVSVGNGVYFTVSCFGLGVSLPLLAIMALSPLVLPYAGLDASTAHEVGAYTWARMLNVVPFLVYQ